jgi:SAM-dependent methyltransferase
MVRAFRRALNDTPAGGTVIDIGCGAGGLLQLIEARWPQFECLGVDIATPDNFLASVPRLVADASALPLRDASVEGVILNHVLEHVSEVAPILAEARRVLKPSGWIYIETPNAFSVWTPFGPNFWDDPTHVRPYTATALAELLDSSGLSVTAAGTKRSLLAITLGLPAGLVALLFGKRGILDSFWSYTLGLFAFAVGRKADARHAPPRTLRDEGEAHRFQ